MHAARATVPARRGCATLILTQNHYAEGVAVAALDILLILELIHVGSGRDAGGMGRGVLGPRQPTLEESAG